MSNVIKLFALVMIITFMQACHDASNEMQSSERSKPDVAYIDSAPTGNSTHLSEKDRKLMRTAEIEMEVQDIKESTLLIEKATKAFNGLVMKSQITNQEIKVQKFPQGNDSLKLAKSYQSLGYLTLRLPANNLDSFLHIVDGQAQFMKLRNIYMEDATLNYIDNILRAEAISEQSIRMDKADKLAHKTQDIINMNNHNLNHKNEKITHDMNNMYIDDKVQYATVEIQMQQNDQVQIMVVANIDNITKPTFMYNVNKALSFGWDAIKSIIIGLIHLWPLLLLGIGLIVFKSGLIKKLS